MKKIIMFIASVLMVFNLAACSSQGNGGAPASQTADETGGTESRQNLSTQQEKGKTLVVYYSASGNTREVANYIASAIDGDLFEIVPAEIYTGADLDWTDKNSRISREHDNEDERDVPLVSDTVDNWDEYDTVFVGYPKFKKVNQLCLYSDNDKYSL